MRARVHGGVEWPGGVTRYPLDELFGEVAFLAYHLHWDHDQLMGLEHVDRRRWVAEVSDLNRRMNGD